MQVRRNDYGGFWVGEGTDDSIETDAIVMRSDEGVLFCWDCLAKGCIHVKAVEEFEAVGERE